MKGDTIYWPLAVYLGLVVVTVAVMLVVSYLLGQRRAERATEEPYESGMAPIGTSRLRFDIQYYLVAMFFVVFDLESVFIFSWSVAVREAGWAGYIEMVIFIAVLLAALAYLWRVGALDWPRPQVTGRQDEGRA
ncbi:MAG: NADH-quinone oxidoreductase subunit A [Nitrospirota bacterium]|jgi:NADH-quinone oxidoreductase subunit A